MKQYTDRHRTETVEYKARNLVLISTRDLKWQMVGRCSEKLTEQFIGPYRIKAIISSNIVELDLPTTVKIYPVVNVSRIKQYISQVNGQRKEVPQPITIKGEVERILNKRKVQGKDKFLVWWKGFMVEEDT